MAKVFKFLLYLTIMVLPLYIVRFKIGPIPSTVLEVLIYLTFIIALVSGKLRNIKSFTAVFLGGALVLLALTGVIVDPDKIRALGLWKAYFVDGFLLFLVALSLKDDEKNSALWYLVISGALTSVFALIWYFLGTKSADGRLLDLDKLSPNYLAMFLTPIIAVSLALSGQTRRSGFGRIFALIAAVIMLATIYLTRSRGAIIALGIALLVLIFSTFIKTKFEKAAKILLAILICATLAASFWYFKPDWSDHARKATSSNIRYYIWSTSVEMVKTNPLWGVGISNYQDYFSNLTKDRVNYPEYISPEALTAHNLYLHIYLTAGLLGLITFMALIFTSRFWKLNNLPASVALVSILAYGLVDTPFSRNDLAAVFWLVLGLIFSAQNATKKS